MRVGAGGSAASSRAREAAAAEVLELARATGAEVAYEATTEVELLSKQVGAAAARWSGLRAALPGALC